MKKFLNKLGNKIAYIIIGIILAIAGTVYAINVTVPQSTVQGSLPIGNSNGTYTNGNLIAGSNVTINTSTPGQITISSSASGGGGGSGGGWATATPSTIYNVFGNVVGINSTTPTANLVVQGSSTAPTIDILRVASSSNSTIFSVQSGGLLLYNQPLGSGTSFQTLNPSDNSILFFYPKKASFRAGEWDTSITDAAIGDDGSVAFGYDTVASGNTSFVSGENNTASGFASFSSGSHTTASSSYATAMGRNSQAWGNASMATGVDTKAKGDYSFTGNDGSEISGQASTGFGEFNLTGALAQGSFVAGVDSEINGDYSFVFGENVLSDASHSITLGTGAGSGSNRLSNNMPYSFMVGFNSTIPTLTVTSSTGASTLGRVGIGTTTPQALLHVQPLSAIPPLIISSSTGATIFQITAGQNLLSELPWGSGTNVGDLNADANDESIFIWNPKKASFRAGEWDIPVLDSDFGQDGATCVGYDTKCPGQSSFAGGTQVTASGNSSFAFGGNSDVIATSSSAVAMGSKTTAGGGIGPIALGVEAHAYGDGAGAYSGDVAGAYGNYATVIGGLSNLIDRAGQDSYSIILGGQNNIINGTGLYQAILGGSRNTTNHLEAIAIGTDLVASSTSGIVIGRGVKSGTPLMNEVAGSVMIGSSSTIPSIAVIPSTASGVAGFVGIGTTTPGSPLVVVGSTTVTSLQNANCDVLADTSGNLYCGTNGSGGITTLATGTAGNIFNGSISGGTLTLNLPFATIANTGQLQGSDFLTFNNKLGGAGTNGFVVRYTGPTTTAAGILRDDGTVAGVNATSSNVAFTVKGIAGNNAPLVVASSTGTTVFQITPAGIASTTNVNISALGTCSNGLITTAGGVVACNGSAFLTSAVTSVSGAGSIISSGGNTPTLQLQNLTTNDILFGQGNSTIATSSNFVFLATPQAMGINSSTPQATLALEASTSAQTLPIFNVASTSHTSFFQVSSLGNVNIATLTASSLILADGSKNLGSYGGASNCASGTAVIGLSIAGATTCSLNGLQAALTNPDTGTGANGQVAYFTGATSLTSSSAFLYNGSVVGINATSSTISLNVQGTSGVFDPFNVASSTGTSILKVNQFSRIGVNSTTPSATFALQGLAGDTFDLFRVATSTNTVYFDVTNSGNVGIGTMTPISTLSVIGDVRIGISGATSPNYLILDTKNTAGTPATSTPAGRMFFNSSDDEFDCQITNFWRPCSGWEYLASTSTTAALANFSLPFPAKKHLHVVIRIAGYSGLSVATSTFNSDQGANYAWDRRQDVLPVSTGVSQNSIRVASTSVTTARYITWDILNPSGATVHSVRGTFENESESSAATAPVIGDLAAKWISGSNQQITSIQLGGGASGVTLSSGTSITVWGSNDYTP